MGTLLSLVDFISHGHTVGDQISKRSAELYFSGWEYTRDGKYAPVVESEFPSAVYRHFRHFVVRDQIWVGIRRLVRDLPGDVIVRSHKLDYDYVSKYQGKHYRHTVNHGYYGFNFETEQDAAVFLSKIPDCVRKMSTRNPTNDATAEQIKAAADDRHLGKSSYY